MIILVRAADRLIHGMVAVSWTSAIKPETILVANDEAAGDSFKAATMKLAKPAGVKLIIKTRDDSIAKLNIGTAGVNKKPGEDYIPTLPQVFMTQKEFECAKKMADAGVEVFAQITPSQDRMNFKDIEKIFAK